VLYPYHDHANSEVSFCQLGARSVIGYSSAKRARSSVRRGVALLTMLDRWNGLCLVPPRQTGGGSSGRSGNFRTGGHGTGLQCACENRSGYAHETACDRGAKAFANVLCLANCNFAILSLPKTQSDLKTQGTLHSDISFVTAAGSSVTGEASIVTIALHLWAWRAEKLRGLCLAKTKSAFEINNIKKGM
jgi:hypothetical protein